MNTNERATSEQWGQICDKVKQIQAATGLSDECCIEFMRAMIVSMRDGASLEGISQAGLDYIQQQLETLE